MSQSVIDTTYKNNIVPSPSFTYSPETDVVLGVFALYQYKSNKADYNTRPSFLQLYIASSLNKQVTASFEHNIFLPNNENWYFKGLIEYKKWPEEYYGLGPNSFVDSVKVIDYQIFTVDQKVFKNLGKKMFIGLQGRYTKTFDFNVYTNEGDTIKGTDIEGGSDGSYLGIGPSFLYDQRNSILTPTEKYYFEVSSYLYLKGLGNMDNFISFLIDGRKYFNFQTGGKHVLALQGKIMLTNGEVPFSELAKLGGKEIMRGYLEGRYRDKQYFQIQAEYRVNIIGRFGATAFGGFGNVMPALNEIDPESIKAAAGFGIRFNINRKDPANVRIDFGYGFEKGTKGIYITFGEAF